jgi:hypothetical protein
MSRLQAWMAACAAVVVIALATLVSYGPARAQFAGRCLINGRAIADCHCMAGAYAEARHRRDLPPVYAELTKAWAHDSADAYRSRVYSTVFWQSVRAVPVVRDVLMTAPSASTQTLWERMAKVLAEQTINQIGQRLGVAIVPLALKAKTAKEAAEPVWDFAQARAIVSRHCGGRTHAIVASIEGVHARIAEQVEVFMATIGDAARRSAATATAGVLPMVTAAPQLAKDAVSGVWARVQGWIGGGSAAGVLTEPVAP